MLDVDGGAAALVLYVVPVGDVADPFRVFDVVADMPVLEACRRIWRALANALS